MALRFNFLTGALEYYTAVVQIPIDGSSNGLIVTGNTISIALATETTPGALSAEDYTEFKNKKEYRTINDNIILTTQTVADKKVTLTNLPAFPDSLILNLEGGTLQRYGIDYTVNGQELSWNGLSLDGFLEPDDKLIIYYDIE
jgi:hypothetical protein